MPSVKITCPDGTTASAQVVDLSTGKLIGHISKATVSFVAGNPLPKATLELTCPVVDVVADAEYIPSELTVETLKRMVGDPAGLLMLQSLFAACGYSLTKEAPHA